MVAIPIFSILIGIEIIAAKRMGIQVNNPADMISSLSSGITNTVRDGLKYGLIIISYSWLVDHIVIYKMDPVWAAVTVAFIVQDFTGYWLHRLNHRVNIFWNRHIIHHSSEEFNLACALRQSISDTVKFGAIFMIPAAILGVPASIFAVIGPIHLFLQFWYHTRLINKMGWLEKVIVTPSHHRVHHGINPEYLDKNYSAIFIIWDKLFGTFQPELADVKPVYGILRPANTWNPIIINFKHLWQLIMDAFHAEKWRDKIRIWFMPTGWRPEDVAQNYPVKTIENPLEQIKYKTVNSPLLIIWGWLQMFITFGFMFHLFIISTQFGPTIIFLYALFLFINVFAYTSLLDGNDLALYTEIIKFIMGLGFIWIQNFSWFGTSGISTIIMGVYLILSLGITIYSLIVEPKSPQLKTT
ncbi:MAG: sterol desaturase family protein [Candidatus Marinimicrobia bacterium]|jgi:sterol desaturase/sphingolipid hydroxylase (fatty acid hydroxylase superfamily)|nr:sterol desaturase family protein [Candidatus Neomarinimicrobiota bacterium]MBT3676779.1 sterol desaturase family protein [Candidatus Neomarinimicrobiota bacterium]MBT3762653.1 sterol desaturase family protein [Candidatus Neomarinimicrobiota bacterium]MBT4069523.1 sterol desaturase family protein [Candidatus Neomarinimicrobiota bacterium]MBT4270523.1 sterol desaturase family protein [Candidatus Neomarinimicrobiota bacterium]